MKIKLKNRMEIIKIRYLIIKNIVVLTNKPLLLGHPLSSDIVKLDPNMFCNNWYNAGEEIKKKIIVE